ncbi:glycoside hydrolase family 3 protein [Microbacterium sp. SORGH_AS_0862]|uniref:glycoside hydrolase family 3 protein n=1 Tax=Microbacterium sp. SORGH_AS_0862 TaxID=3041789 RepID=UPI00278F8B20|nr:glycoside hydrolase family 3 N-terminal domain-containing protein [Microbacterium sp. SORGH_AS_0862]MDQ1206483.1 beta-N-acetylhexosaminidase [Microbacterium sp. SORGH_AS_0862]
MSGRGSGVVSVDLAAAPFHLDEDAIAWVNRTREQMSIERKVGQLFCLLAVPPTPEHIDADFAIAEPGGYMRRPAPREQIVGLNRYLQSKATVPLLIAANIETGAEGLATDSTSFGSPLQVAATDDADNAYRMGYVAAREARALGCRWAFAPILDVQMNFRNPIVLTRGFGSDPERVSRMSRRFVRGIQDAGGAASIKHWPGDGVDDRDQHLVTSVNTLSVAEWERTFGAIYRDAIDEGALTLMSAHIALPEYSRALRPGIRDEDILPASLAPELNLDLLRGRLGFRGLIVTDASTMAGMQLPMPRRRLVPVSVAAGCDMFLFSTDYAEDYGYMLAGVHDGTVTIERLDEAVTRVLAVKAALGLHRATTLDDLVPDDYDAVDTDAHEQWARDSARAAITLVKSKEPGVLPLRPEKTPRILLYSLRSRDATLAPVERFIDGMEASGFTVRHFEPESADPTNTMVLGKDGGIIGQQLRDEFDVVIYLADVWPHSNVPTARLDWAYKTAANVPKYVTEVPTIFVSLGSPFHLQDVPRVRIFVNAYAHNDATVDAVVDALTGRSPFGGINPVDPFCGYWDARL